MSTPEEKTFNLSMTMKEIEEEYGEDIAAMYKAAFSFGMQMAQQAVALGNQMAFNALDAGQALAQNGINKGAKAHGL